MASAARALASQRSVACIAVNVAMRNLLDDDFSTIVDELLVRHGCDPSSLAELSGAAITLAAAEGLDAHGRSVSIRLNR